MHESADGPDRRVAMAQTASAAEKMDTITQIKELKGSECTTVRVMVGCRLW